MERWYSIPRWGERLVAIGRVILAAFALVSVVIGPSAGGAESSAMYLAVGGFWIYSLFIVILHRSDDAGFRYQLLTHLIDLSFFVLFVMLTSRAVNPFFAMIFFSLLGAAIRFGSTGTIWTTIAAAGCFGVVGLADVRHGATPEEINLMVLRTIELVVGGGLLTYVAGHLERLHKELSGLAAWPQTLPVQAEQMLRDMLAHAAGVLDVPRLVLVWSDHEEPWTEISYYGGKGQFSVSRHKPGQYDPLVAGPAENLDFSSADVSRSRPVTIPPIFELLHDGEDLIHPDLRADFWMVRVLSTRLAGETGEGRLFFLDRHDMGVEDLRLARIMGRLIVARLDQLALTRRSERMAVAEERVRLARDLHDGLLQSLTATALQIETVRRLLGDSHGEIQQRLQHIHDDVTQEHEDLRAFIRELQPSTGESDVDFRLGSRLDELATNTNRQWGVEVSMQLDGTDFLLPNSTKKEVYRLIREAVTNAAKHARATRIYVESFVRDRFVHIEVEDNGRGFPFQGTYDLETLTRLQSGPRTLKERIASVEGDLLLSSTPGGARLEMKLPLRQKESVG